MSYEILNSTNWHLLLTAKWCTISRLTDLDEKLRLFHPLVTDYHRYGLTALQDFVDHVIIGNKLFASDARFPDTCGYVCLRDDGLWCSVISLKGILCSKAPSGKAKRIRELLLKTSCQNNIIIYDRSTFEAPGIAAWHEAQPQPAPPPSQRHPDKQNSGLKAQLDAVVHAQQETNAILQQLVLLSKRLIQLNSPTTDGDQGIQKDPQQHVGQATPDDDTDNIDGVGDTSVVTGSPIKNQGN